MNPQLSKTARKIKAPEPFPKSVFLAGSIEMGAAENWQTKAENLKYDQMTFKIPEWQLKLLAELWLPVLKGQL